MTLLNASSEMDTLVYESGLRRDNEIYYTMNCKIAVCPKTEAVTLVAPAKDDIVSSRGRFAFFLETGSGGRVVILFIKRGWNRGFLFEYAKKHLLSLIIQVVLNMISRMNGKWRFIHHVVLYPVRPIHSR